MYILGITEQHIATAAILKNGKIIACASEERFTRLKMQGGFPKNAVEYCLKFAGISGKDIDLAVFGFNDPAGSLVYAKKQEKSVIFLRLSFIKSLIFNNIYQFSKVFPLTFFLYQVSNTIFHKIVSPIIKINHIAYLTKELGISSDKIIFIDHHTAHAYAANYIFGKSYKKRVVITNDGAGDEVCGRVFVVSNDKWKEIASTPNRYSLAFVYYYVTKLLGFTPDEEEYKIMGLAPYASRESTKKIYPVFKNLIWCNGLSFKSSIPRFAYYSYLKTKLSERRFDSIASALQLLTEDLTVEQVRNVIKKTDIHEVILGGGLAMNIKANMQIANLPEVKKLLVCPSAGDESTAIGSCFWGYFKLVQSSKFKVQSYDSIAVKNLYLGPSFTDDEIREALGLRHFKILKLRKETKAKHIARLLSEGKIIARFSGRMEFGARALGNRSILADPRDPKIVKIINDQIKMRDFWMPFAPTILKERAEEYLINPKRLDSPFMMIGFNTTKKAQEEIPAALHPADFTCRPQILKREDNPEFYDIIKEFDNLTGVAAVLNTSFNLHGEPIVCTPEDAIKTFEKSGLEYLTLEDYLISKT